VSPQINASRAIHSCGQSSGVRINNQSQKSILPLNSGPFQTNPINHHQCSQLCSHFRHFSTARCLSAKKARDINVSFKFSDGNVTSVQGAEGDSLLDMVVDHNIDIDGFGACEGTLACSTCHLILSQKDYDEIPDQPTDEEYDMLDLAYGLTDTSRLGCQIFLTKDLNNLVVDVPPGIADARD